MTGPYMVTEHTQGKSLKIDRNPVWEDNVAAGLPEDPDTNNVDGFDVTIGVPPDAQVLQIKNGQADFSFDQSCCIGAAANELANDPATKDRFFSVPSLRISYATFNVNIAAVRQREGAPGRRTTRSTARRSSRSSAARSRPRRRPASSPTRCCPRASTTTSYPSTPDLDKAKALLERGRRQDAGRRRDALLPRGRRQRRHRPADRSPTSRTSGINMKIKGLNTDNYYQFIQNPENKDAIAIAGWEADYPDGITFFEPLLVSGAAGRRVELRRLQGPGARRRGGADQRDAARRRSAARRGPSSRTTLPPTRRRGSPSSRATT